MCVLEAGTRIMGKTGNVKANASVLETNYRPRATICDEKAQTPPPSPTLRRKFFRRFSPQNPGFCSFCSARSGSAAGGDGGFVAAGRRTRDPREARPNFSVRPKGAFFTPSWRGLRLRPAGAKLSLAALCAELPRPRQGRSPSVREPCFPAVLGSQPPRRLCRQPPLHKGALYGAAALSRPALAFCGGERYNHLL